MVRFSGILVFLILLNGYFVQADEINLDRYKKLSEQREYYLPFKTLVEEKKNEFLAEYYKKSVNAISQEEKEHFVENLLKSYLGDYRPFINENEPKVKYLDDRMHKIVAAAICYAACEIQSVTPIYFFKEDFSFEIEGVSLYYTVHSKPSADITLKDFPVMYLAFTCKEKSITPLTYMINNSQLSKNGKVQAFAIMCQIDNKEASSLYDQIKKQLSEEECSWYTQIIKNPVINPWKVPLVFSSRYKSLIEKARKGNEFNTGN